MKWMIFFKYWNKQRANGKFNRVRWKEFFLLFFMTQKKKEKKLGKWGFLEHLRWIILDYLLCKYVLLALVGSEVIIILAAWMDKFSIIWEFKTSYEMRNVGRLTTWTQTHNIVFMGSWFSSNFLEKFKHPPKIIFHSTKEDKSP